MKELKILHLEDSRTDSELIHHQLKKSDWTIIYHLADNKEKYMDALKAFQPDVILSDHKFPQFDSLAALEIYKKMQLDIPFILVTGTVSEEFAVTVIKSGADDYILKSNILRLNIAIENTLQKRESERKIRNTETQNRLLLETMSEGVVYVNNEDIFLYVNNRFCELLGYTKEELIGKKGHEILLGEEERNKMNEIIADRKKGIKSSYEIQMKTKSGEKTWMQINGTPVIDEQGNIIGSMGTHRDISHLKENIKQLEEIIFDISHKVRQPIANILGLSNLLDETVTSAEEIKKVAGYMKHSALSLDTFTKELTVKVNNIKEKSKNKS